MDIEVEELYNDIVSDDFKESLRLFKLKKKQIRKIWIENNKDKIKQYQENYKNKIKQKEKYQLDIYNIQKKLEEIRNNQS